MDANRNVIIKSMVEEPVGVTLPDLHIRREWPKKGAIQKMKFSDLEEGIFDPGFEYMIKTGMLYIEDMDVKRALDLEPEEAEEPTNLIVLTEAQQKRYLTVAPIHELRDILGKLSREQKIELAHYAIKIAISDMSRCALLEKETEINVAKVIVLNKEAEAEEESN